MIGSSEPLAVASSITYGAADFLGGLATKRGSALAVVIVSQAAGFLLVLLATFFLPSASPTAAELAWGGLGGLAGGIGIALLYRGLATGTMSVVAPVTAVCAVIVPVAVGVALGERPAGRVVLGILLAIAAIVLISRSAPAVGAPSGTSGVGLAIASGIAIGIFLVCLERTKPASGLWPLVAARVASVSFLSAAALLRREPLFPGREAMPAVLGCGVLDMLANVLYVLAVRQGTLSVVATLTSLYPASTILLARILLRERLRPQQLTGVACAAIAIVLIVAR